MASQDTRRLADKLVRFLEAESSPPDLAAIYASIEKINHRLDKLESSSNLHSATGSSQSFHPSLEKFAVAEAIGDEIFPGIQKEKACTFEPNGKPCDHCAMCNSRGF